MNYLKALCVIQKMDKSTNTPPPAEFFQNIIENMKIYLSDLMDVFHLLVQSDMIQTNYKKIKNCIEVNFYNDLFDTMTEPLIKRGQ